MPRVIPRHPSGLRAALLVVHLDLVLDAVVQFEVVVLQCGGAPRGQPGIRARAVEEQTSADGPKEDAEGAHCYNGHQDGIQGVQPAFLFVQLRGSWRVSREQCVVPIRSKVICSGMGTYYPGITFYCPLTFINFLLGVVMTLQELKYIYGNIPGFTNPGLEIMWSTKLPIKLGTLIHF